MKTTFDTQGLQSVLDGQLALGLKAVEAIEQLGALQVKTTKALIEQTTEQHAALLGTKSPQELSALASGASQPLAKISLSYLTEATALAMDTSRAVALTTEAKVQESYRAATSWLDEAAKSAPPGSEAFFKAAREMITVSEKAWSQFLQQAHVASEQVELYVVQPTETQKAKGRRKA